MLLHRLFTGIKAATAPTVERPEPERVAPPIYGALQSAATILALASLMIALKLLGRVLANSGPR